VKEAVMSEKVVFICDPGIDGAIAVALALHDPDVDVLGLAATPGNIPAEQATTNVHILVEQIDPPRWPRLGAAPPVEYDVDGRRLHGPTGLGNTAFPCVQLHHPHPSDKLICDLVKQYPKEIVVVCLGPLTVLARALDREPELTHMVKRLVCLGGAWHEPGNAGPVSEFHFYCDPLAAHQVLQAGMTTTLIPLDVMRKVIFAPTDLGKLPDLSRTGRFLRQIIPFGVAATTNLYGIEGFHLKDVLGVVAVAIPSALRTKPMRVDVEVRGALTRGMSVFDLRPGRTEVPNVDLAVEVDTGAVKEYMDRVLALS
jgi:inosine-uridine nucleoside N-ribohydrolase